MKRKRKLYLKPKRPFEKVRIDEEAKLKKDFGLKNKGEIWKAEAKIKGFREKAKKLISAGPEEQAKLFEQLNKIGLKVNSIADVLSLEKEDFLKRRLQTILVLKNLSSTTKTARQLITHKKVLVDGKIVNIPSYIVPVELEDKIKIKVKKKKEPVVEKAEEKSESEEENKEEKKE